MAKEASRIATWAIGENGSVLSSIIDALERTTRAKIVGRSQGMADAVERIAAGQPEIVLLDIARGGEEEGIRFIGKLNAVLKVPVLALTADKTAATRVLQGGAYDTLVKPEVRTPDALANLQSFIGMRMSLAAIAHTKRVLTRDATVGAAQGRTSVTFKGIIALGASTGGTEATFEVLRGLPGGLPGMVIVQHMPPGFTAMYAERLNRSTPHLVREAGEHEVIRTGEVLIAPGDRHMRVVRRNGQLIAECFKGERVNGHCPSVGVLFDSVAAVCGKNAVGIILTGMGADGAQGILGMRRAGAYTIGQDEATSVVYGMPKVAFDVGGIAKQGALQDIPGILMRHLTE